MKIFIAVVLVVCLALAISPAIALENGVSVKTGQVTLISGATGTTGAYNTSTFTFDNVMKYIACDLITGATITTSNTTLVLDGNQGSSTTLFDGTPWLIGSTTLASSVSAAQIKTVTTASSVPKPFRTIRATITTAASSTQIVTLNCSASQ